MKASNVEEETRTYGEEEMGKEMHLRDRYDRDEKKEEEEEEEERRQRHASVVVSPSIEGGDGDDDGEDGSGGRGTTRAEAKHVAPTSPSLSSSASRDGAEDTRPADEEEEEEISDYQFYQSPDGQPCFLSPFTTAVLLEAAAAAMTVDVRAAAGQRDGRILRRWERGLYRRRRRLPTLPARKIRPAEEEEEAPCATFLTYPIINNNYNYNYNSNNEREREN